MEKIVFGGGCFWCTEAVFSMIEGVELVLPGYTGGTTKNPSYETVCSGNTGHIEVVEVVYDKDKVRFEDLLTIFFGSHDPTSLNRQGNDVGTQYRSSVFYTTEAQREEIINFINRINSSSKEGKPVVTEVKELGEFYEAESYHKDYFARNGDTNPYCAVVINPKLKKVQKNFAKLLKK